MTEKKHIAELKKNADFMRDRLTALREELIGVPVTVDTPHGEKENPAVTAYEKMLKSYQAVLTQINQLTGEQPKESAKNLTIVGVSRWKRASND